MDASLTRPRPDQLAALAPLAGFSAQRLAELAQVAVVERARRGSDPLHERLEGPQSVFLLAGELVLAFEGGGTLVVVGGSDEARQALNRQRDRLARSKAITDVDLVMLDDEVLDILATWDQVAAGADSTLTGQAAAADARIVSGAFGLGKLRSGAFAQLPVAHIDELLKRFERVKTAPGETVIREGDQGDYYFVVESGRFSVERLVGGAKVLLAELKSGDAFGEEALVSEAKRNATVTSLGEGELLRLGRTHFDELLREPLLRRVAFAEAAEKVRRGALWLDVRYPSEYQYDKLPGAINVPLAEVRNMFAVLDRSREYVAYCQSGRRSAAAAFLFAQRGFKVWLLEGGLRSVQKSA
ncbi:MAG TPA: cyclic nucleotide-binding domain-containing protein [Burkholderiales bacterium]|jgi:CRP-like cAMP-binding protein|nr:cyclic nucleotide-binding domain-containing protein [Burkholderiales bacterium]